MVTAAAFSPDGKTIAIAAGGDQGKPPRPIHAVRLFDARTGVQKWEHKALGSWAHSVAFSPDGETLACGDGAAKLLDTRTGRLKTTLKPSGGYVMAVAFSPDGRTLAGGGSNTVAMGGFGGMGRVTLWGCPDGNDPPNAGGNNRPRPEGRLLARWQGHRGRRNGTIEAGEGQQLGARVQKEVSEVRLLDVATGRVIWTAEGESDAATSLAYSPDGKSLAFCDADYVYLLDATNGELRRILMETTRKTLVRDRPPAH